LTNQHIVKNDRVVTVILADGRQVQADVIGSDKNGLDLAVVKMRSQQNLPIIPLATPGLVQVGQPVYAIGAPLDAGTFTNGIVSHIDQQGFIQTNAGINRKNSGGPLLNSQAQVIGVNAVVNQGPVIGTDGQRIATGEGNMGIGFAISVDRVKPFLTAVIQGSVPRYASQQSLIPKKQQAQELLLNNQLFNDTLGKGDAVLPNNSYYKLYMFEGRAEQQITIEMNSKNIDPTLILLDANLNQVARNDDISPSNFNSRIVATLPKDGHYIVVANSSEAGESGAYSIRARVSVLKSRISSALSHQANITPFKSN